MKKTLLLLVFLLSACDKEAQMRDEAIYSETFVRTFILPDEFSLSKWTDNRFDVRFAGTKIESTNTLFVGLCDKYGNHGYNGWLWPWDLDVVIAEDFISAEIVCNRYFDETHPAGSSLGDIIKLNAGSPYDYIQSGYTESDEVKYTITDQYLNQLTKEDMILMGDYTISLYFTVIPAPGEYTFTVTFRSEEKELSSQMTVTF